MPSINKYRNSRYLKQDDIAPEALVTYTSYKEENVSPDGEKPDLKPVLFFKEFDKGWVANITGLEVVAGITGEDDMDDWVPGLQLVLFVDPNVYYGGKKTGGIRIRKP